MRQGRTDAWIAHKLDIGVGDLARFKREHQLEQEEGTALKPADPLSVEAPEFSEIEEEEDEEEEDEQEEEVEEDERPPRSRSRSGERSGSRGRGSRPPRRREPRAARDDDAKEERPESRPPQGRRDESRPADRASTSSDEDGDSRPRRRRGRRGGRRHRARRDALEATFDHGEEGYGLWLDPSVVDNPVYSEHWAGHRAVTVSLDADSIVIRRVQATSPGAADEPSEDEDDE